jgi:hypothetical protein
MPIPDINEHYKVRYRIEGHEKEFETEAYPSYELADEHRRDIKGFEGVHSVYLFPVHPPEQERAQ